MIDKDRAWPNHHAAPPALKTKKRPPKGKSPPGEMQLWFALAWNGWLKNTLWVLVALLFLAAWYFDLLPEDFLSLVLSLASLGVPVFLLAGRFVQLAPDLKGRLILTLLAVLVFAASAYPVAMTLWPRESLRHRFEKEGDRVELAARPERGQEWIAEVHGRIAPTADAAHLNYEFRIGPEGSEEKLAGALTRNWTRVKAGYKSIGRKLVDNDRKLHHLDVDLSVPGAATLKKLNGPLEGPLELSLRPEPVTWAYLAAIMLPLLLASALVEVFLDPRKKKMSLLPISAFWLIFSFLFADNSMPGLGAGPFIMAAAVGLLGGFLCGWLLPKLLRPLMLRLRGET